MKKFFLLLTIFTAVTIASFAQWTSLSTDPSGDGQTGGAAYLDGTKLEYRYDNMKDSIFFRVTVANMLTSNYGINIVMNVTGAGGTSAWIGSNHFMFNRVITAWITSGSSGTVGVTDANGWNANNYKKLGANNIKITMDAATKTYTLGMKRTDIYNDTALKATVIAATGSNQYWDDDVPDSGSGSINVSPAVSVQNISMADAGYSVFPNPVSGVLNISRKNSEQNVNVRLLNAVGQEVYSSNIHSGSSSQQIDVHHLPEGVYFLQVTANNYQLVEKILCQ